MKETVGKTAGRVWELLKKNHEMTLSQLPKALKQKDTVVYQAVGWLAREDKIEYHTKGNKTVLSVKE
jgi:Mn-dependent DtxR family transcriptional regulator